MDIDGVGGTKTMPWADSEYLMLDGQRYGYEARDGLIRWVWLPGGRKLEFEDAVNIAVEARAAIGYPRSLRRTGHGV